MKNNTKLKKSEEDILNSTVFEFRNEEQDMKVKFTLNDVKKFSPMTKTQDLLQEKYKSGLNLICDGVAGVGKTFCVLNLAAEELMTDGNGYDKIVIIRSAVSTRDIGFLPGSEEEKMEVFEKPYEAIFKEIFKNKGINTYKALKNNGLVEFKSASHMRGETIRNSLILIDESQNFNYHELSSAITRVGENTKIFLCGDIKQSDLIKSKNDISGIERLKSVAERMDSLELISFTKDDIVRSGFVKEFYLAEMALEEEEAKIQKIIKERRDKQKEEKNNSLS